MMFFWPGSNGTETQCGLDHIICIGPDYERDKHRAVCFGDGTNYTILAL